ncbi:hypothetical protein AZF37_01690 [endosymbiont 'TC1' of Trimyema compressum]|uniref:ABC transporter substrate-binding protein n=1 Tax=endosymbiont 'TC1' of Trimyema compressum TaxID=243899 RepID=UPI0007F0C972|nr:ABC transporter substrate-binding protein [endosymbiont 'TC1' of Trimyema compressum]AMP20055.1 hypothetical protein AZF37_01690 [endosymbiont 'TC1' of Trimyema compressum]
MKKVLMTIVLIMGFAIFLGGCGNKESGSVNGVNYPLTITDSTGSQVTIEKEPKKVVSFSPVVTETVTAIGKKNVLVGRTSFCDYPPSVESIPVVGNLTTRNMELVAGAEPDVVLASAFVDEGTKEQLKQLGIPLVVTYSSESFNGAYDDIEMIGKVLNGKDKSKEVIDGMKSKVSSVETKVKETGNKPSVYYVLGFIKGDFTATGETFINEMITMAGGTNIAADGTRWSYNKESLIEKNPDILILNNMAGTIDDLKNTEGYKDLDAVKNNKVYLIDSNLINRAGPRLALGLEALAAIIHPEIFSK